MLVFRNPSEQYFGNQDPVLRITRHRSGLLIKVDTQTLPTVARIIPDMSGPLMLGNNYRNSHAEDPETHGKLNAMKNKKIFFFSEKKSAVPNLTEKTLKRMQRT